jgi:excisionase family DNA binding protein
MTVKRDLKMNPIELSFRVTIDEANIRAIVNAIRPALPGQSEFDPRAEARMKSSRNAIFAGQKPPEDRGLLINTNEVAKLLKVSARTVYRMERDGEMPNAIRIGKAVRWSINELQDWIRAGCPKTNKEEMKPKVIRVQQRREEEQKDAANAFRNWTCGVPMTPNGKSKLRERLRQFAERLKTENGGST